MDRNTYRPRRRAHGAFVDAPPPPGKGGAPLETPVLLVAPDGSPVAAMLAAASDPQGRTFTWTAVERLDEAVGRLLDSAPEAVLLDVTVSGDAGLAGFARLYAAAPEVPIVVVGPRETENLLIRAVHQGACDYLVADQLHPTLVRRTLRHAIERQHAERERSASERRYREIFEQSTDAILLIRPDGAIVDANPAFLRLTGSERSDIPTQNVLDLCEDRLAGLRIASVLRRGGSVRHAEIRLRTRSGDVRDCLLSVRPRQADEGGYLANVQDVSQRKAAEAELRRTQEQFWGAQKMEAVGRLAGGIAHDFNNLLGVIGGSAELVLLDLEAGKVDQADIQEIIRATHHAARLTRHLLAFSRKQVLQPRPLDLNRLVEESVSMLQRLIRENISIVTRLDPGVSTVEADPSQLNQVLMNIAVNASDAMPMGGQLVIETANAELHEGSGAGAPYRVVPGRYAMLAFTDTGTGMTEETRARVFEPFFTTKAPGEGTGLGLATVYGIVKQSGGYIWLDSAPGEGTTFRIYLPSSELTAAPERPPMRRGTVVTGGATVLVVEDDPGMRSVIVRTLERAGHRALEAADVRSALEVARTHPGGFELLLTDVILPGPSGRELAERLQASHPELRVLYMSGHPNQEIARHGVLEEGVNLLEKPFSPEALLRAIRSVLDGEAPGDTGAPATGRPPLPGG